MTREDGDSSRSWLSAVQKIAELLADRSDASESFDQVLEVLDRDLGMKRGTIALVTPDSQRVVMRAARGQGRPPKVGEQYGRGEGIIGRVVASGEPAVVVRPDQEPAFLNRVHQRDATAVRDHSFVCVPVQAGGTVVGSLCADIAKTNDRGLEQALQLLSVISAMLAHRVRLRREWEAEREAQEAENLRLRDALGEQFQPEHMIGSTPVMHEVFRRIRQLAAVRTPALILGEPGTGKQSAARAIHFASDRAREPFIPARCGGMSDAEVDAELFGHDRSAAYAASYRRIGLVEQAEGGTLYLEDVAGLGATLQMKVMRLIQEGRYRPADGEQDRVAEVRIIAGSSQDLSSRVADNRFREDLYYGLAVLPIALPPLRDRRDDIVLLADAFLTRAAERMNKAVGRLSTTAINMLMAYHWPGNVRELENCIERAVLVTREQVVQGRDLPPSLQIPVSHGEVAPGSLPERVAALERDMLTDALKRSNGNISAAARELGLSARQARYKIKSLGIEA